MMEDLFNFLLTLGLSERQVLVLVFWVADSWLWLIGGNMFIAGAINYIRSKYGDCTVSWSLLVIVLLSTILLGLLFFAISNLGMFLGWLLITIITLNFALGRRPRQEIQ